MNTITFPILVMALIAIGFAVCLSRQEHNRSLMKAQGKPVPEERQIVNVIDWTRR